MAALIPLVALLAAISVGGPPSDRVDQWQPLVEEASTRFGVPKAWIEHVLEAESGGRTAVNGVPVRSRAGAMGLMQLMPATWAEMRALLGLGGDPDDPHDNILAGTLYLRRMYDRFGYPGLFAAYNGGPSRYSLHLATGAPLPAETRAYLAEVSGEPAQTGSATATLFAIGPSGSARATNMRSARSDLFVVLNNPSGQF